MNNPPMDSPSPSAVGVRLSTSEFVSKAMNRHGGRYDYALVGYSGTHSAVEILCGLHGPFLQTPSIHLSGYGCQRCGLVDRYFRKFLTLAQRAHGDRYDYDNVNYLGSQVKVSITCPVHGDFLQKPSVHLRGSGCQECAITRTASSKRLSEAEFIEKAREVHGYAYGYEKSVYRSAEETIEIECFQHGAFVQRASSHLRGQGCKRCAVDGRKLRTTEYIASVASVYDCEFDYSQLIDPYVPASARIRVRCLAHGEFEVNSRAHLVGRANCPKSKGGSRHEREIYRLLSLSGLIFHTQWTSPGLKDKAALRFDFYIPSKKMLVEYDGAFHHKPIKMPGMTDADALEAWLGMQRRDAIKTAWAASNGHVLVRLNAPDRIEQDLTEAGVLTGPAAG